MYDSKVEQTTSTAIKLNLNGIKTISKERILVELYKILDLTNFIKLNRSTDLKEIFLLIFPEFENLDRLEKFTKICNFSQMDKSLLLAALLIDDKNSHEYFSHKYNISNDLKNKINLFAKHLNMIKENKEFFNKDLEKNIYLNDKNHLVNLNILNFIINPKINLDVFSENLKRILKSKSHQLKIDGRYLIENGMQQGELIGKVLKEIEKEWIKNNFQISKDRVKEIIRSYSN